MYWYKFMAEVQTESLNSDGDDCLVPVTLTEYEGFYEQPEGYELGYIGEGFFLGELGASITFTEVPIEEIPRYDLESLIERHRRRANESLAILVALGAGEED